MDYQIHDVVLVGTFFIDLDRRNADALFKNGDRICGHGTRNLAANIGLMPEVRGPGDQAPRVINWKQNKPVVTVTYGALADL